MSVQSEIERISGNVANTYSVLAEAGSTMPEEQNSNNLSEAVRVALTPVNPDWSQSDYTKKDYIKNRTHYQEKITVTWDGTYNGLGVYEVLNESVNSTNSPSNYVKLVRVLDHVPVSLEDLSIFGLCKYSNYVEGNESSVFSSDECVTTDSSQYIKDICYQPKIFCNLEKVSSSISDNYNAEAMKIQFRDGVPNGREGCRVVCVLSEGTVGGFSNSSMVFNLPVGVYFSEIKSNYDGSLQKTLEYTFTHNVGVSEIYLGRSLSNYSRDLGKNLVEGSYSLAEGKNNHLGRLLPSYGTIYSMSFYSLGESVYEYVRSDFCSHVEGYENWVLSEYSHGEGYKNKLRVPKSHIEGTNNTLGEVATNSTVSGGAEGCHVEGSNNVGYEGKGIHIEGYQNTGSGDGCHVEGWGNTASGEATHVQNKSNSATSYCASASGLGCVASGNMADAGGSSTQAKHVASFTRGQGTISGSNYQAVLGTYNEACSDSIFDVGNGGSGSDRRNALSVKKDGSARIQLQGETEDSITRKDYVDGEIKRSVDEAVKNILSIAERVNSWETVQKIVRAGYAPMVFKVGDQLICNHSEFGELVWDIIGFDHDVPTDSNYSHSMTLQLHDILDTTYREYDAREALFCASEELNPGKYCLSHNSKTNGSGTTSYAYFTIPEGVVVPVGGLIVNLATSGNVYTILKDCFSTDSPLGTVTVATSNNMPAGYTLLGESNYYRAYNSNGSSSFYKESNIRFYLNSNSSGGLGWTPQNPYDMPPSYVNSSGFMYGLDVDFKNVLGKVNKKLYDVVTDSVIIVDDFVFLPSRSELYGGDNVDLSGLTVDEESPYEYYASNSGLSAEGTGADSNRIKYGRDDVAYGYYLRSLVLTSASVGLNSTIKFRIGRVNNNGGLAMVVSNSKANSTNAYLAPCCCIV